MNRTAGSRLIQFGFGSSIQVSTLCGSVHNSPTNRTKPNPTESNRSTFKGKPNIEEHLQLLTYQFKKLFGLFLLLAEIYH